MTKTSRNSLLVSATDAVFEMQIDNGEIYSVIWPPPDISTRSTQEEQSGTNWMLQTESLNTVHVVRPGPLVAIKGYEDLFVLTEETKSMIRIINITDMTIYRLCNDGRPTTTAPNCPVHSVYSLLVSNVNCTLLMFVGTVDSIQMATMDNQSKCNSHHTQNLFLTKELVVSTVARPGNGNATTQKYYSKLHNGYQSFIQYHIV